MGSEACCPVAEGVSGTLKFLGRFFLNPGRTSELAPSTLVCAISHTGYSPFGCGPDTYLTHANPALVGGPFSDP